MPETTLPALKNFLKLRNSEKFKNSLHKISNSNHNFSSKFYTLVQGKRFNDHNLQKMSLRVIMAEAMPAEAKYNG